MSPSSQFILPIQFTMTPSHMYVNLATDTSKTAKLCNRVLAPVLESTRDLSAGSQPRSNAAAIAAALDRAVS